MLNHLYIAASPPRVTAPYRTEDYIALIGNIRNAETYIDASVMDYSPTTLYPPPHDFWPLLDDAIRDAAYRGVQVRLLVSCWQHTIPESIPYLLSLSMLENIELRWMRVNEVRDHPCPSLRLLPHLCSVEHYHSLYASESFQVFNH